MVLKPTPWSGILPVRKQFRLNPLLGSLVPKVFEPLKFGYLSLPKVNWIRWSEGVSKSGLCVNMETSSLRKSWKLRLQRFKRRTLLPPKKWIFLQMKKIWSISRFAFVVDYAVVIKMPSSDIFKNELITYLNKHLSRDMWFPTMLYFDKCRLRRACTASF